MNRTSQTHPIRVDAVPVRHGLLGLTFCPGKHGDSLNGGPPSARDLDTHLRALCDWGASLILTLIEQHEFGLLRVPDLGARVEAMGAPPDPGRGRACLPRSFLADPRFGRTCSPGLTRGSG